jgi:diguanylate cyclase (GGDEF)-like protein/PAS domain S-box-containing protein
MDSIVLPDTKKISEYALTFLSLTNTPAFIICDDSIIWANESFSLVTKIATSELERMRVSDVIPDLPDLEETRLHLISLNIKKHSNELSPCLLKAIPLEKNVWGFIAQAETNPNVQTELQLYKDRFWLLADQAPVGIFTSEVALRLKYVNPALSKIFQYPAEKLLGTQWLNTFTPVSRLNVETAIFSVLSGNPVTIDAEIITGNNIERSIRLRFTPTTNPEGTAGFVGTIEDISELLAKQSSLEFAILHDALTGLYNRQALLNHLEELLNNSNIEESVLLFCDLNGFKLINDNLGHVAGDRLLIEIASNLRKACPTPEHIVYRFAGDEFVILAKGSTLASAEKLAQHFTDALNQPFVIGAASVAITASIGFATLHPKEDPSVIIKQADERMYKNKHAHYMALGRCEEAKGLH